jgi:putative endonuclease
MAEHNHTGEWGEQLACQWLEAKGYTILHRNWRHGRGEIDIVAREGGFLVVVEVKTRRSARWGEPELAVGPAKRRHLMQAATELLHTLPEDLELRFDVMSITGSAARPEVLHIPDAFYPTL